MAQLQMKTSTAPAVNSGVYVADGIAVEGRSRPQVSGRNDRDADHKASSMLLEWQHRDSR